RDLAIDTTHDMGLAIGRAHMDQDRATDARIGLADRIVEVMRSPPLRQMSWFGPHAEHELARRVEGADKGDLALGDGFSRRSAGGRGGHEWLLIGFILRDAGKSRPTCERSSG